MGAFVFPVNDDSRVYPQAFPADQFRSSCAPHLSIVERLGRSRGVTVPQRTRKRPTLARAGRVRRFGPIVAETGSGLDGRAGVPDHVGLRDELDARRVLAGAILVLRNTTSSSPRGAMTTPQYP